MTQPKRRVNLRKRAAGRAVHDVGGLASLSAPIDRHDHEPNLYEKRVDALVMLLGAKKNVFKIDALRRVIEDYAEQEYDTIGYYEKWIRAVRNLVIEQELIAPDELDARITEITAALEAEGRTVSHERVP